MPYDLAEAIGAQLGPGQYYYTDGSRLEDGRVGAAVVTRDGAWSVGYTSKRLSNYDMEALAVLVAARAAGQEACIFTDCQGVITTIKMFVKLLEAGYDEEDHPSWKQKKAAHEWLFAAARLVRDKAITLRKVKAHSDSDDVHEKCNSVADALAKRAALSAGPLDAPAIHDPTTGPAALELDGEPVFGDVRVWSLCLRTATIAATRRRCPPT